ncbi:hypothetical protein BGX26_012595 [Mortierella sp. AD094]|nr:hypothetical protein BGX26_012595 [Mortierella sp. AD094]
MCPSKNCKSGETECGEIDKCACSEVGQTCGSNFPSECNYDPNSLYYCKDEGDLPSEIESCLSGICSAGNKVCDPHPCLCTSSGQSDEVKE